MKYIFIIIKEKEGFIRLNKTTVGHTGSNDCGDDKVTKFSQKEDLVVVNEAVKRITNFI